ncbi:MAG TPA: MauE/DoxX family redox-associated membrane protein [Nitrosopumilaceae archaeon]|nr:MauE/DoxX family redox-associated membrane protein [Nitrosopumilaceae archaeon]
MDIYTCPMHPEVRQDKAGNCPKCGGMKLVLSDSLKATVVSKNDENESVGSSTWKNYIPLAIIISLISVTTVVLSFRDSQLGNFAISKTMSYFMIGFFLVFAGFKLIGLKGFAEGYSTYDLLARRISSYGYAYPFIELFFGLAMILNPTSKPLLLAEILIMSFSGLGVTIKLRKKEKFQCVCLGTILKVPLTKITVVEDFGMAVLALVMLFIID